MELSCCGFGSPSRRGSRPVYQVSTNLSDFLGIGPTLINSHNILRWLQGKKIVFFQKMQKHFF